jgi:ribosomal protein S7
MRKIELAKKLVNHIMKGGNKNKIEKILLQSLKKLQKDNKKKSNEIFKLAVLHNTPIFKVNIIRNKKMKKKKRKIRKVPTFITNNNLRFSLAMKILLKTIKKGKFVFFSKFTNEILLSSQQKSDSILVKNDIQKDVLLNKRYFQFFKWK